MYTAQRSVAVSALWCPRSNCDSIGCTVSFAWLARFAVLAGLWIVGLTNDSSMSGMSATALSAQEPAQPPTLLPLSTRIDSLLTPEIEQLTAPEAEAGQLLRRLSLDLRGVVPIREELDAFVADQSADRWSQWVARFLTDPLCDEHLVTFLDRTLMLRRPHAQVDRVAWINFLREQVAVNTSIDALAKQLLFSPWWNREQRTAQKFFLDRTGDPNLIARDIGRVFLGRDMQCAQCHDHPLIDDYKQIDYHGLLAYVSPSGLAEATYKNAEGKDQKVKLYVERAAGDAPFESVFDKGVAFRSGPRLLGQSEQFEEYQLPDARYATEAPAGALAGVAMPPKVSRRQALADQLTARSNRLFVANWANRLWSLAFGQGLVQPLDMHHPHNPPSHPALFELITDGLLQADMRPRQFLEQLVLTQAYRRGTNPRITPIHPTVPESLSTEVVQSIRATATVKLTEAAVQKELGATNESKLHTDYEDAIVAWRKIQGERASTRLELDKAEAAMLAAKKKVTDAAAALAAAQKRQLDTQARITLLEESSDKLQQAVTLAGVEDAELKQAVAIAKQRADTARTTIPELDKVVISTKAAADAVAPELVTTTANVNQVVTKLQPIHQSLSSADSAMIAARATWSTACLALKNMERTVQRHQHVLAWLGSLDAVPRITAEIGVAVQSVSTGQAELSAVNELIAAARSQFNAAQQSEQAAASELAKLSQSIERHNSELAQLKQSLDSLAVTARLLTSAADALAKAQESIAKEIELRGTQTGAIQTAFDTAKQLHAGKAAELAARTQELTVQQTAKQLVEERLVVANAQVAQKQTELVTNKEAGLEAWRTIRTDYSRQLAIAVLQPLTPEQLCWSTLRVTGVLDAYIRTELAELDKSSPLAADADDAAKALRQRQAVRGAFDKLRGNADVFVSLYASGADKTEDDFFASADQALYTANAGSVFAWAGPGNNNVTQQAIALTDNVQIAKSIYWSLLCRQPSDDEIKLVNEQIAASGESRNAVIQEMVWGLLASAEFRFVNGS